MDPRGSKYQVVTRDLPSVDLRVWHITVSPPLLPSGVNSPGLPSRGVIIAYGYGVLQPPVARSCCSHPAPTQSHEFASRTITVT
jgi:hypothetical protein